ncbi:hypothetical protein EBR77_00695 [bacterium]|nr:hypothetical protein [bacterium]
MIPAEPYRDWISLEDRKPYKTQVVEVLTYQPAVYVGENEYGCDIWQQYTILDRVIYWRPLIDRKAYQIIYPEILKKHNSQNFLEK